MGRFDPLKSRTGIVKMTSLFLGVDADTAGLFASYRASVISRDVSPQEG